MRIIEYGELKPQYCKCPKCKSVLEITHGDLKFTPRYLSTGPQYDGKDVYVRCPVCGHKVLDSHFTEGLSEIVENNLDLAYNNLKGWLNEYYQR